MSNRGKIVFIVGVLLFLAGSFVFFTGPGSDLDFWQLSSNYADIPSDFKSLATDILTMTQEITNKPTDEISFDHTDNRFEIWTGAAWNPLGLREIRAASSAGLSVYDDAGTLGLHVEDGGQVGIGTAAPAQMLDISSTAPNFQMTDTTGSAKSLRVVVDANVASFYEAAGSAGDILSLQLSGKYVGIGTANPASPLHVIEQSNLGIRIQSPGYGTWEVHAQRPGLFNTGFAIYDRGAGAIRLGIDDDGDWYYYSAPAGTGNDLEISGTKIYENTSKLADKQNIKPLPFDPFKILDLADCLKAYERRETGKKEWGSIAEDIAPKVPELCNFNDSGEVVGIRYKMAGWMLIPVVKQLLERIEALERQHE